MEKCKYVFRENVIPEVRSNICFPKVMSYLRIKEMIKKKCIPHNSLQLQVPNLAIYIPDFITQDDEDEITKFVNNAPLPKWTQLSHRRLQNWGGIPHPKGMIAEQIPSVSIIE